MKDDGLIVEGPFLLDAAGKTRTSIWKIPSPTDPNERGRFGENLKKHGITLATYDHLYRQHSIPSQNSLAKLAIQHFEQCGLLIPEYHKYSTDLKDVIAKHLKNGDIVQTLVNGADRYSIDPTSIYFYDKPTITSFFPFIIQTDESTASKQPTFKTSKPNTSSSISIKQTATTSALTSTSLMPSSDGSTNAFMSMIMQMMTSEHIEMFTKNIQQTISDTTNLQIDDGFDNSVDSTLGIIGIMKSVRTGTADDLDANESHSQSKQDKTSQILECARKILHQKSVLFDKTDLIHVSTHTKWRDEVLAMLVKEGLIKTGDYFVTRTISKKEVKEKRHEGFL
ncbi:unnamed protein product, partial [Didymodactylos carnosus]